MALLVDREFPRHSLCHYNTLNWLLGNENAKMSWTIICVYCSPGTSNRWIQKRSFLIDFLINSDYENKQWIRVRLHLRQNRHNTANQHLSGYTSQTRAATFNPTCVSILIATLQRHSNPVHTAAGIWPDCRLETNSLCWRQTVGGK